jgi:hypothetical protein
VTEVLQPAGSPSTSSGHGGEAGSGRERQPYRLALEPDGVSWRVRENLTDILRREILGPADGLAELIEVPPDTRYLIGRIAPARLIGRSGDPVGSADDADEEVLAANLMDSPEGRGVLAVGTDENAVDADTDEVDDQPQKRGLMIPASMGLRFQIPADLDQFAVTASWGVYRPEATERHSASGRPIRAYRRTPVEVTTTIAVGELPKGRTKEVPLIDEVALRIDSHPDGDRLLVEIALCNDRETPRRIPMDAWMFQTELVVEANAEPVFLPVADVLTDDRWEPDLELRRLNLQYRDRLEFAMGRTCSAGWDVADGARVATRVFTTWLPISETPQTAAREIESALLDMVTLANASPTALEAGLRPIVNAYSAWLDEQADRAASSLPTHLQDEADEAIHDARRVRDQLAEGLEMLLTNDEAQRCFRFMNQVMADQRIQSQVAELRGKQPRLPRSSARDQVLAQGSKAHSWRTFQLAFIVMQIPSLIRPELARRSGKLAKVELLFFPTGGGKTEAYLGLAAFAFAARRRQGVVVGSDGPIDGRSGVAVLMRYTLRMLTSQQFQRATAMVCAAELRRRAEPEIWGSEPFRIGLWVGTEVSPKRFEEADAQLKQVNDGRSHRLTVRQIQRCPWCGSRIEPGDLTADPDRRRVFIYCGDPLAECPFSRGGAVDEGLPVLTVDEEIYRQAPAFVIATVDKFARLAREGEAAALFGYVRRRCDRHGYVHDDYPSCQLADGSKHYARGKLPAAAVHPVARLRPPDLIIQDELHLITGALGTTVGLFEIAIDALTTWTTADGAVIKPVIVASTATIRNARDQVRSLYGRGATVFPPQVLDAGNTFFAEEAPASEANPGRRYLGLCTTGVRLTLAEIRLAEVLMAGAQLLLDRSGACADPYLTLVGYFSSVRELAGMTRYLSDDVQTALAKGRPWTGLPRRTGTAYGALNTAELTARVSSGDITTTLDQMGVGFDPAFDSTAGKVERSRLRDGSAKLPTRPSDPYDAILATAMLQVGVDVTRLGLMLMVGQPKNTAEYIQASSRVGRDPSRPGLVVTLGNWARPRDLAHFEQFRHYHERFYAEVEALSVTPFSATSRERGLDGVLVSVARVLGATSANGLSPERAAGRIEQHYGLLENVIEALVARAARASDPDCAEAVRLRLRNRLDQWRKYRELQATQHHKTLVYERVTDAGQAALVIGAEEAQSRAGSATALLVVANSMREVQPEINLLVSPAPEKLFMAEPPGSPRWEWPTSGKDGA